MKQTNNPQFTQNAAHSLCGVLRTLSNIRILLTMARTAVEQIKERLSILDVVGSYVELQKAGKSFKGKSPFTQEKTPSFFVSPDRGMYYCFSTQRGGDIFTFIQEMEGIDFKGALKILAEKAHVELVPEDPHVRDARETQYALLKDAEEYFFKSRGEHLHVESYIESRGVHGTTIHTWRIGYAPDEWRALRTYLKDKGYTDAQMLTAGLIKQAGQGKEPYDVFRDRIMFPIMDASGRVVAFSGRTLKSEQGIPKYVNSPETDLYKKSEILYGYDKAKQGIRHYDFSLIVEGQFDLVLSHQAGYVNAVAVSGTAFTEHHLELLKRLSHRTVLALDSDKAGIAAVKRTGGMMLTRGMDVKVARMPFGKDPADVVRQNPDELKHAVGSASHIVEFLLNILEENTKDPRTYKLRVREEVLPLIANIDNRIDREHFEALTALRMATTKDAVHYEVTRMIDEHAHSQQHTDTHTSHTAEMTKQHTRKETLAASLFGFVQSSHDDMEWARKLVNNELQTIFSEAEYEQQAATYQNDPRAICITETMFGSMNERDLCISLSDQLTDLSHVVGRERLADLRTRIEEAEKNDDTALITDILKETKDAEFLLQSERRIQKP